MKPPFALCLMALCLLSPTGAWSQARPAATAPDLPATAVVRELILNRPEVRAATASLRADQAEAERLQAGPHEFVIKVGGQQRLAQDAGTDGVTQRQRYLESQLAVERTLRSPAKAQLDQTLADVTVRTADVRRDDAIHEASRALLRTWFDWLREQATVELWSAQLQDQQDLVRMATQRVKAGDAAHLELRAQEAALTQAQADLEQAQARAATARALLDVQYPGLSQAAANLATPAPLDGLASADAMPTLLAQRSHEVELATLQADLAHARARRVMQDRVVDPTVGIYAASERGGAERVLGVTLSMPWPGQARQAADRQALQLAQLADEQVEAVRRKIQAESAMAWLQAQSLQRTWRLRDQAQQRQHEVLQTTIQGWQLGEFSQADVLIARRQYVDSALMEIQARSEARHAALRVQLDLHDMWVFDDDGLPPSTVTSESPQ